MSYSIDNVTLISHDDVNVIALPQKGTDSSLQRKYEFSTCFYLCTKILLEHKIPEFYGFLVLGVLLLLLFLPKTSQ